MGKVYEMLITKEKMQECIEFEYQYREDVPIFENDEDVVVSAYARVSSTKYEQIDAVKYQKSVLDKWLDNLCQINPNCHKGKIYVDTKTGRTFKRDAYQEMIEDAKRGRMNYIIFWETSRFGRNLSNVIRECLRLKDEYSVDLYFIDKQISTKTREGAYSARTAHPFRRNGAPFRFKLSKAQQVDYLLLVILRSLPGNSRRYALDVIRLKQASA